MNQHSIQTNSLTFITVAVFTLLLCCGVAASGETKIVDDHCDYNKVPLNTAYKNDCSPIIFEDNFIGIKINAPGEVRISQSGNLFDAHETRVPITGYYNVMLSDLVKDSEIKLIVENAETGKRYSGTIVDHNTTRLMADRAKNFSGEKLEEQSYGAYVNPNLVKYVQLPNASAEYNVNLVMGQFESNTVKIKINTEGDTLIDW